MFEMLKIAMYDRVFIWSITIDALVVPKGPNSVCTRSTFYRTRYQNYLQDFQRREAAKSIWIQGLDRIAIQKSVVITISHFKSYVCNFDTNQSNDKKICINIFFLPLLFIYLIIHFCFVFLEPTNADSQLVRLVGTHTQRKWHPKHWLKPGFHMIVRIVPIVLIVSKIVWTIGTIIWKRYPDDRKRPGRLRRPRSLG